MISMEKKLFWSVFPALMFRSSLLAPIAYPWNAGNQNAILCPISSNLSTDQRCFIPLVTGEE